MTRCTCQSLWTSGFTVLLFGLLISGCGREHEQPVSAEKSASGVSEFAATTDAAPAEALPAPGAASPAPGPVRALEDVQLGAQPATEMLLEAQRAAGEALPQLRQDPGLRPQTPLAAGTTDEFRAESLLRQAEAENLTQRFRKAAPQPLVFELQPGEELWVIARSATSEQSADRAPQPHSEIPGCGALAARLPGDTVLQPVPLKHTAVNAQIDGYISSVDVTQQFHNPWSTLIEAEYVFPLPENAAVHDFVMQVGDRRIRGIIREREKAEQIYSQARAQGHTASLLTQERPNIFTQKVANIEPGQQIDIQIRYFSTLRYDSGAFEFVFPMVVGPRFNPAWTSDGIGAVSRHEPGASGQSTEVPYLTPGERSGHDVSLTVHINAGMNIEDIRSVNHRVDVQTVSECERGVVLSASDTIPNRDFVLRYTVAGDQIRSTLLTHSDKAGQYFTMLVCPPAELRHMQRSPLEMVFVLDCSGSMQGRPLEQARTAIAQALQQLTPRDSFQIIQFSSSASQLGSVPLVATPDNVRRGQEYLNSLRSSGGTNMLQGIHSALAFPHDEGRLRVVCFMTDGFIGNEQEILTLMHEKLGVSRVFSFGVGQAPNRYLMDRMAILGRGAVSYLSLNDEPADIMDRFQQQISHPAMTDLAIDFGDMQVTDVYPQRLPDLIVGRPVIVTGRFQGDPGTVTVHGRTGFQPASVSVRATPVRNEESGDAAGPTTALAAVWARMKIADLLLSAAHLEANTADIQRQVTETALHHNLMSSFTAFVAVDSLTRTSREFGTTVAVPVPVPEGVRYDTTVSQ